MSTTGLGYGPASDPVSRPGAGGRESTATVAGAGDARLRLLELRQKRRLAAAPADAITPRSASSSIPLSFSQEGLWFLDQLSGPSGVYNVARAYRLRGRLETSVLERALRALVERHESLRTAFVAHDGAAVQLVQPAEVATLLQVGVDDAAGGTSAEREQVLQTWLTCGAVEPFDLAHAPLLRARLLRLGEDEHVLQLVVHHIVYDGWSNGVLMRELGALVASGGEAAALPELAVQFADYAIWQRQRLAGPAAEADLAYWRKQLEGIEALELPGDRARPAQSNYHGARECFTMAPLLLVKLKALARRENATLFMVLLAAFQVLLMRYSGQQDIAVGSPVAGRSRTELEGLIGYFVNTLVLRSDLSGSPSFVELLGRVRQVCLDAYAHQEVPFDRLVAELSPQRDLSRNPLYQVSFALQNVPASALVLGDLRVEPVAVDTATARFDLSVALTEDDSTMTGVLEYSTQLFDAPTAGRMARHYQHLLQAIADQPQQAIERLPLMDEPERTQLLFRWNDTAVEYPPAQNVHQRFAAQVLRSPEAPAVVHAGESIRYDELDRRVNRLAHHLRALGVARGALVGLCLQRSPDMVVAQLAILQSGAAYVPLDPAYPADRLSFMVEDAGLALLVTESALGRVVRWPRAQTVLLDADSAAVAAHSAQPLALDERLDARPEDPAYVIYTSGSTGKPKGVVVPHRAVVNFLSSMAREPGLSGTDCLLAVTTLSFDIAVLELLLPLTVGARTILAKHEQTFDGQALRQLLESSGANVMQATPATWRMLIDAGWQGATGFKALVGGESLPPDLALQLLQRSGQLWNMYGPTETTVWSTCWRVRDPEQGIWIGRPIANTQVYILDAQQQVCPIGVPGEICIGGDGLASGYLHRPELTSARFIHDPLQPQRRLYRTGDLGRWRHDGQLEHRGRLDHQVKLRGFRIELGEIEANLASHAQVARTVVVVREDQPGDQRLVAYIVARETMPAASELREHLRAHLPDYMLPQHFVQLDSLPLLPNGKLDRKALPQPHVDLGAAGRTAPSTPLEQTLVTLWCELLGATELGVDDNFFELGGHSLLAARLVHRINSELKSQCTLLMLFRAPTIRRLAVEIEGGGLARGAEVLALQPQGTGPALFCICGVHLYQALADRFAPDIPVYGIFLPYEQALLEGSGRGAGHLPSVEEMAADYVRAIRMQQPRGPYCLAGVSFGGLLAYEVAQQLSRAGEQVRFLAMLDAILPGEIRRDWLRWTVDLLKEVRHDGLRVLANKLRKGRQRKRAHGVELGALEPQPDRSEDEDHRIDLARRAIYKQAARAYTLRFYGGPAILVLARDHRRQGGDDRDFGQRWSEHAPRLQMVVVPGDHLGILKPPHVHELAAHLRPHIESARQG